MKDNELSLFERFLFESPEDETPPDVPAQTSSEDMPDDSPPPDVPDETFNDSDS